MTQVSLTCADLFCGAGGFSEGFRQAGFRVTKAVDIWAPAVATHEHNHPDTEAIRADVLMFDPARIGPVDVLIGSPPCTEFSFANRGGNGDVREGMRLVYRFLRFVYELQPRWWIMENVPRVLEFLPREVPLQRLGIDKRGSLVIPIEKTLISANYGAPQKRARAFSGNFPLPPATHEENEEKERPWRTLRDVVQTLPDPLGPATGTVRDPIYDLQLPAAQLTDHFSPDLILTDEEVRENRKAKADHSWYGRMSFPDELDRPARTVMATNLRVSRETTVIDAGGGRFRRLSVREASSVQGFPITYQWWARSASLKYKLVGNAVAPPAAYAIARAILSAAERPVPTRPHVIRSVAAAAPPSVPEAERKRSLPLTRRFREHIPGSKVPGFRVDLDNRGQPESSQLVRWRAVLYRGSGKSLRQREVGLDEAVQMLERTVADRSSSQRARAFLRQLASLTEGVPDGRTLQLVRAERESGHVTPYLLIERIAEVVGVHFSTESRVIRYHSPRDPNYVPARIAATLVAASYVAALANDHPIRPALRLPRVARTTSAAARASRETARPEG